MEVKNLQEMQNNETVRKRLAKVIVRDCCGSSRDRS